MTDQLAVNLPLQRADFVSDEAWREYLDGIASIVFAAFLQRKAVKHDQPV